MKKIIVSIVILLFSISQMSAGGMLARSAARRGVGPSVSRFLPASGVAPGAAFPKFERPRSLMSLSHERVGQHRQQAHDRRLLEQPQIRREGDVQAVAHEHQRRDGNGRQDDKDNNNYQRMIARGLPVGLAAYLAAQGIGQEAYAEEVNQEEPDYNQIEDRSIGEDLAEEDSQVYQEKHQAMLHRSLQRAIRDDEAHKVGLLISSGADVNFQDSAGESMLHLALRKRNYPIVALLLDRGADVNSKDAQGDSPLHIALRSGQNSTVQLLIEKGADLDATDKRGFTPLTFVLGKNDLNQAYLLIEQGANVNAHDAHGASPLELALEKKQYVIARRLLEQGADVPGSFGGNLAPVQQALRDGQVELVELLMKGGARYVLNDPKFVAEIQSLADRGHVFFQQLVAKWKKQFKLLPSVQKSLLPRGDGDAGQGSGEPGEAVGSSQTESYLAIFPEAAPDLNVREQEIVEKITQREKSLSDTHYCFYHAHRSSHRIAYDLYRALHKYFDGSRNKAFTFFRWSVPDRLKEVGSAQEYFSKFGKPDKDTKKQYQEELLSVNLSLFGNHRQEPFWGEGTWHYFTSNFSISGSLPAFMDDFLGRLGLEDEERSVFSELTALLQGLYQTKQGVLYQIAIPKEKVADVVYLSHAHGKPITEKIYTKNGELVPGFDEEVGCYTDIGPLIDFLKEHPEELPEKLLRTIQGRVLFLDDMFDSESGIEIFRYGMLSQEEEAEYQDSLGRLAQMVFMAFAAEHGDKLRSGYAKKSLRAAIEHVEGVGSGQESSPGALQGAWKWLKSWVW